MVEIWIVSEVMTWQSNLPGYYQLYRVMEGAKEESRIKGDTVDSSTIYCYTILDSHTQHVVKEIRSNRVRNKEHV